jgi:hypothetical protein
MYGHGESDEPIVPAKAAKAGESTGSVPQGMSFWELFKLGKRLEGRGSAKENGEGQSQGVQAAGPDLPLAGPAKQVERTQSRQGAGDAVGVAGPEDLYSAPDRVRLAARRDKGLKFTSLWHHVYDVRRLREAYLAIKRDAAPGVDGQTWEAYGRDLEANLRDLSDRLARGAYRAKPVKRAYVPKADGRQRPIGVPALEDKIVQRATVRVLNAVYETDFLGFSYGFRPGRSAHTALDALAVAIQTKKVNYVRVGLRPPGSTRTSEGSSTRWTTGG